MGLRLSQQDAEKFGLTDKKKSSKYKNVRTSRGFDSKKEERRFDELAMLEACGKIKNLRRQVTFHLVCNNVHVCSYRADYVYLENEEVVVEDCKGFLTDVYKIKRSLMRALQGITIRET